MNNVSYPNSCECSCPAPPPPHSAHSNPCRLIGSLNSLICITIAFSPPPPPRPPPAIGFLHGSGWCLSFNAPCIHLCVCVSVSVKTISFQSAKHSNYSNQAHNVYYNINSNQKRTNHAIWLLRIVWFAHRKKNLHLFICLTSKALSLEYDRIECKWMRNIHEMIQANRASAHDALHSLQSEWSETE